MDIYHYHPDTGELIGFGQADPDPRVPDNWLIPAYATTVIPPAAENGHAVCWVDGEWQQVTDLRGRTAYKKADRTPVRVEALGDLADELTLIAPPGDDYMWSGDGWVVDEQRRAAYQLAVAIGRRAQLIAEANDLTAGMADAYIAGLMSPEEETHYRAMAAYKLALSKLPQQTGWPAPVTWPTMPAPLPA